MVKFTRFDAAGKIVGPEISIIHAEFTILTHNCYACTIKVNE
jgi:hypothetical protein